MSIRRRMTHAAGRARFRSAPLAEYLLEVTQLPGSGWQVSEQRAWEAGMEGEDTRAARRAFAARLLTVRRSFLQRDAQRRLWVQIIPLVSGADAMEVFDTIDEAWLTNLRPDTVAIQTHDLPGPDVEGAKFVRTVENTSEPASGLTEDRYTTRALLCLKGIFVTVVAGSSDNRAWPWTELATIAETQLDRLPG